MKLEDPGRAIAMNHECLDQRCWKKARDSKEILGLTGLTEMIMVDQRTKT